MTLGSDDLRTLGLVETGDTSDSVLQEMQRILTENQLVTAEQLVVAADFLQSLGVQSAVVFQALDFNHRIALYVLAALPLGQEGPAPDLLRREAARPMP